MKNLKKKGLLLFIGFSFMLIGFGLTTDMSLKTFGLQVRMFGNILQLIFILILAYFFLTLPPFSEFDWQEKIEAVFMIDNAGICLYYKIFSEKKELMDEQLISAAISSINVMLQSLTETTERRKTISVIKKKGQNVIIYHSNLVTGVLYTSEELNFPKIVLKEFVEKFETLFYNKLKNWDGNTNIFKNLTEIIVKDIFY